MDMQQMALSPIERRYIRRENPPHFRITPRVVAILNCLRVYGLLTSQQIAQLDGGSHQKCLRLLQLMFDHGLVDRPGTRQFSPLSPFFDARPLVYSLSRKGAHVLSKAGVDINTRIDRTTRNKRAVLIEHTIGVASVMMDIAAACTAHGSVRLIDQHDLIPFLNPKTRDQSKPFELRVSVHPADFPDLRRLLREQMEIGLVNDRIFGLSLPDQTAWMFGLEYDRGGMPVIARSLKRTSFLKKQLAITAAWQAGLFAQAWGPAFTSFRILTIVTMGEGRIRTMLESQRRIGSTPSGLCLYTTAERLAQSGPLSPIWITSKRDGISLLDRN